MRIVCASNFAPVTFILPRYLWNLPTRNRVPNAEWHLSIASSLYRSVVLSFFPLKRCQVLRLSNAVRFFRSVNHPINQSSNRSFVLSCYRSSLPGGTVHRPSHRTTLEVELRTLQGYFD